MSRTSSHSLPPVPVPAPVVAAPAPCGVPSFDPLRVRGGGQRLRRALLRRRRAFAAGLAVTAAALAASGAGGPGVAAGAEDRAEAAARAASGGASAASGAAAQPGAASVELVTAPVRIADVATVRLLRPGDRVDVIAAAHSPGGGGPDARVLARGVRVRSVPPALESATDGGALVLLTVAREVAAELAGAGTNSRLAVTLC
ncbi:hypothetical protein OG501_23855 [Streptomyces niveus]|uniref:hypothetical protein n=1 Tax=Streptomyces niveus TaxID=193462 RepID=UPI00386EDCB6